MQNKNSYTIAEVGEALFKELWPHKTRFEVLRQIANVYSDNELHADRMYEYMITEQFMPSSPVISSVPFQREPYRGLPISCYLSETTEEGLYSVINETCFLSRHSGGLGTLWNKTNGILPHINTQGRSMKYCGGYARKVGAMCAWLRIDHYEIIEFINMRRRISGNDCDLITPRYIHHGVVITDEFMLAVKQDKEIGLKEINSNKIIKYISARYLYDLIIELRFETGEPFIFFEGNANRQLSPHHKELGLTIKTTNLCTEITLITGKDHYNKERIAVCCLSSINLAKRDIWIHNHNFIEDIARFMDNVLTYFNIMMPKYKIEEIFNEDPKFFASKHRHLEKDAVINSQYHSLGKAAYSAYMSRDIGVGVTGLQTLFQNKNIAVDIDGKLNPIAKQLNIEIFKDLREQMNKASIKLGQERGACQDAIDAHKINNNIQLERFSYKLAIAPTTVISAMMNSSPGIQFDPPVYIYKNQTVSTVIYNEGLTNILNMTNNNNTQSWQKIKNGEYQNIITKEQFDIYKGGNAISSQAIIEMASDRAVFLCQAQSINLCTSPKATINTIRKEILEAFDKGIKTLYYSFNQVEISVSDLLDQSINDKVCKVNDVDCAACAS